LKEINRVAKTAFVTTPNRNFPIETHTGVPLLHHLPKDKFDFVLKKIGKGWATGNHLNLLDFGDLKKLLKMAGINDYRIVKNRIFCFVVDFVIII